MIIREKYVDRFDEIINVVDRIYEETHGHPFAIFVQTEKEIDIKNPNSFVLM